MYVVTEHVIPLESYLQQNDTKGKQNELAISWGLHQIVVCFLNDNVLIVHSLNFEFQVLSCTGHIVGLTCFLYLIFCRKV